MLRGTGRLTRESLLQGTFRDAPIFPYLQTNIPLNLQGRLNFEVMPRMNGQAKKSAVNSMKRYIGFFFDQILKGIYNGAVVRQQFFDYINSSIRLDFDAVVPELNLGLEAKAIGKSACVKLRDDQTKKYLNYQLKEDEPTGLGASLDSDKVGYPKIEVYLFRHHGDKLFEKFISTNQGEFARELSTSIEYIVIIPFSLFYHIFSLGFLDDKNRPTIVSRYQGDSWRHHTRLTSTGLDLLLTSTDEALQTLDLNPTDYQETRFTFPQGIQIGSSQVTPFPVLKITDSDYSHWIAQLKKIKAERKI